MLTKWCGIAVAATGGDHYENDDDDTISSHDNNNNASYITRNKDNDYGIIPANFITAILSTKANVVVISWLALAHPTNKLHNKYVIITSKRRFDVIITYLLHAMLAGQRLA